MVVFLRLGFALTMFNLLSSPVFAGNQQAVVQDVTAVLKAHTYVLDNGLTVVIVPNKSAPHVSINHWVKAGSLNETRGVTGIALRIGF